MRDSTHLHLSSYLSTYCDDWTAVTNGTKQSAEVIEWLHDFGKKYSGMKVNFGIQEVTTPVIKSLKEFVDYTKDSVRYLGVFVGNERNSQEKMKKKFREKIIFTIGKVQRSRSLSIEQRLLVLNALLTSESQFFFKSCFISEKFLIENPRLTPIHIPNPHRNIPLAEESIPITKLFKYNAYFLEHGDKYRLVPRNEHDIRLPSVLSTIFSLFKRYQSLNADVSFIDNRNSELEKYMFMTAPSAHKVAEMRTQIAYVDIYKPYPISAFQHQRMDDHVLAKENSNFLTPKRIFCMAIFKSKNPKKGQLEMLFFGKNDVRTESQFSHSMGCENLKDK
eukprot:Awhi_evm2s6778